MNKSLIYIIVGVVVVAAVVGVVIYNKPAGAPSATNPGGEPAAASSMSMKDLFAKGGSQKCTFSSEENGTKSSGLVYVSGGHMRGDFVTAESSGQSVQSHMITDGQTAYVWTNQMPQGFKMSFSAVGGQSGQAQGGVSADQKADYSCGAWSADQSEFSLPSDITFTDLSAAVKSPY